MYALYYTLQGIAVLMLFAWAVLWIVHLTVFFYSRWKLFKAVLLPPDVPLPGVSILKPLLGDDPNLVSNLETFFSLDYPIYEILFCVEDEKDPAAEVARLLMMKYPNVQAKLVAGGANVGVNPKINNIQPGLEAARYELLLISDASIRMRLDALKDMVAHMRPEVALVHQMPFTADRPGFAAALEKVYFGTAFARIYLISDFLSINCHTGMSSMVRRTALEEAGGLAAIADYLAEDFFLADALESKGWKSTVSSLPALQNGGRPGVKALTKRLLRWAQLRTTMIPGTTLLEPLTESLTLGALSCWAMHRLFGFEPIAVLAGHALTWFLLDWLLLCAVQGGPPPMSKCWFLLAWLLRETTGPIILLLALARPTVTWRTRRFRLSWGGRATELQPHAKHISS